jgi:aryl-alcohol dehydrogenase-like predicted oxidoreductase
MKVLGRGQLARDAHKAIQYVLGLGTVHAMTIGTTRQEHLRQNLALVEELAPQYLLLPAP